MSRLASAGKMQFYPTSPADVAQIALRLTGNGSIRILDPCAGEGNALAQLTNSLKGSAKSVYAYGVELDYDRAELGQKFFPTTFANADLWAMHLSNLAVSLLFLNPPYDEETVADKANARKNRLEWTFLRQADDKLQPGGVLVYLVPQLILAKERIATYLAAWYDKINLYTVVAGESDRFHQVVLFGVKRAKRGSIDASVVVDIMTAGEERPARLNEAPSCIYTVPPMAIAENKFTFRKQVITRAEMINLVRKHGAQHSDIYAVMDHPDTTLQFQPVTPLKMGHVAAMIASGATPIMNLGGQKIIRGITGKHEIAKDAGGHIVKAGREDKNATKVTETFVSDLYTLTPDGTYGCVRNDPDAFKAMMMEYGTAMHADLTARYKPLYSEPTPAEWAATGKYMHGKRLPGMKRTGLLNAQRHVVIANVRTLRKYKHVNDVADMGTGKTAMAAATVDMLNAWPAVLFVPAHMVYKWQSELPLAVPGAKGFIARNITDIDKFLKAYKPGAKWALIMGYEKAKLGAGPIAVQDCVGLRRHDTAPIKDEHDNIVGHGHDRRPTCPKCGDFITIPKSNQARKCKSIVGSRTLPSGTKVDVLCGEPLYQKSRIRRWPLADYIRKQAKGRFKTLICDELHKSKAQSTAIARAFHQLTMATTYTINLTGTLFGGKSTDLFFMLYRLLPEVRASFGWNEAIKWIETYGRLEKTLIHTDEDETTAHFSGSTVKAVGATEKPGINPRIYSLLLSTTIFLRIQDLGYRLPDFEETVVTLDMSPVQRAQYDWFEDDLYKVIAEGLASYDGGKIKIARQLLSVWLTESLMRPNEGFRSRTVRWTPPHDKDEPGHHEAWCPKKNQSDKFGYGEEADEARLQTGCVPIPMPPGNHRGSSRITPELAKHAMHLYPVCQVDEMLPKEEWLVEFCTKEQKSGRKTIVGIQQTGTRDIQDRIMFLLAQRGIKAAVLPDELEPAKREMWIAARAPFIDVLLTNPKKVETGLDLIAFANLIVYELPTSLFTLAQFVRRVWRLGQTQPVKTFYLVYRDSMEHRMLGLIASKVMAAALLYGDDAGTAMSAETDDEGNLQAELAKQILNKLPIITGINAILSPTMQQEIYLEELEDVDMAELAAEYDAEERAEAAGDEEDADEEDEDASPSVSFHHTSQDDDATPWWQSWGAVEVIPPAPTKKGRTLAPVKEDQLDFFSMATLAAQAA